MAIETTASRSTDPSDSSHRPLPHRLRLLFVGAGEPPWALLALRLESAGCVQPQFDWETDISAALARLRKTAFDCILVGVDQNRDAQTSVAVGFVEALRASGSDDPLVVLLGQPDDELTMRFEEQNCELLVTTGGWQSRALVPIIRRAVARGEIRREVTGLEVTARRGRLRERDEAESHLDQLRGVIARFQKSADETPRAEVTPQRGRMTGKIDHFYRELLRTYVMMGSGNLGGEVQRLAELLSLAGLSTMDAMAIHLEQLEALLQGLGNRSSRHVMARADLLALELVIMLGERYRQKPQFRGIGDTGIDLMYAESLLQRESDHEAGR